MSDLTYQTIKPEELQPCDLLFFHGDSFVNKGIQTIDGGIWNHLAIVKSKTTVAHAITGGFQEQEYKDAISETDKYIQVVRFCGDINNKFETQLGSQSYPLEPVLERVNYELSVGHKYAFDAIAMLMIICTVRRIGKPNEEMRNNIDKAMQWLEGQLINDVPVLKFIEDKYSQGKEMVICSQMGFKVFESAGDKYKLSLIPENVHDIYQKISSGDPDAMKQFANIVKNKADEISSYVTPHDLFQAPQFAMSLGFLEYGNLQTHF